MIHAIRKEEETSEKLLNRFKKAVHNSRIVLSVRGNRYFAKKPSKRLVRIAALKRSYYRNKRNKDLAYS